MKLTPHLQSVSEAVFGTNFAEARIHSGPEATRIGARAFALGHEVYFAEGQYSPETREGLFLLGHELAHVVQQKSGRIRAASKLAVVHDPLLEWEANVMGACFAEVAGGSWTPARPIYGIEPGEMAGGAGAIQCLMDFEAFKTASSASGFRNKIEPVDTALKEFHRLNAQRPRDWAALLAQLRALFKACQTYARERPGSDRQPGVDKLTGQIGVEEPILAALADYQNAANADDKWEHLEKAQERYLTFRHKPEFSSDVGGVLTKLVKEASDAFKTSPTGSAPILRDLAELKRIGESPLTPAILKTVIGEVTAARNVQQLSFTHANPYMKYNVTRGAATKYTLSHALEQGLGKTFRLGSLLHELTHASIAETFGNTVIMFAIKPDATEEEILKLAKFRKGNIMSLQALVAEAPLMEPGGPRDGKGLTQEQKDELKGKADYAIGGKIGPYLEILKKFPQATVIPEGLTVEHGVSTFERMLKCLNKGMRSELVEYDTVINQMALWCHLWKLDMEHPVYRNLRDLAQEAYGHRALFRLKKQGPPKRPPPKPPVVVQRAVIQIPAPKGSAPLKPPRVV